MPNSLTSWGPNFTVSPLTTWKRGFALGAIMSLSDEINHLGSVALARAAKEAGVARFVYASSCSIYGAAADGVRCEDSEPNPQTAYADCKRLVERDVQALASETFSPTFLRNATAFGASPRIRFDIVPNNLAGLAWTTGRITMTSDGMPWRPLVHVRDIGAASPPCWRRHAKPSPIRS